MLNGWYYNKKYGQRPLSLAEISLACCCTQQEILEWFPGKIFHLSKGDGGYVDAGEVVGFLVRNNMPTPSSLLPPCSRKLLFITSDLCRVRNQLGYIEIIFNFFKQRGNVLIDNASEGRFADLSILTFSPDVVAYFVKKPEQASLSTFNLLMGFPELLTIMVVGESSLASFSAGERRAPRHLVVGDRVTTGYLKEKLEEIVEGP